MHAKGSDANNLRVRFRNRLKKRKMETKESRHGTRWLEPEENDLLIRGEVRARQGRRSGIHPRLRQEAALRSMIDAG